MKQVCAILEQANWRRKVKRPQTSGPSAVERMAYGRKAPLPFKGEPSSQDPSHLQSWARRVASSRGAARSGGGPRDHDDHYWLTSLTGRKNKKERRRSDGSWITHRRSAAGC